MNKMFKIGSVVAVLALSGMLTGCGSSSSDDDTPKVCTVKATVLETGKAFDKSIFSILLNGKEKVTDFEVSPKVDSKKAGSYPVKITSPKCDGPLTYTVVVKDKEVPKTEKPSKKKADPYKTVIPQ